MSNSLRKILITGATGKQGRALISALRPAGAEAETEQPAGNGSFHLLALTRDASGPSATSLKSEPHVTVVQGDLDSEESLRKVFEDAGGKDAIWGVFMVLAFPGLGVNADGEEKQGKVCMVSQRFATMH